MIKELKLKYPSEFNGEEYLTITSILSPFYFEKYDGFGMLQIRQEIQVAGNRDGMVKGNSLYGGRIVSVEGKFHCHTRSELLRLRGQLEYAISLGQYGYREPRDMIIVLDDDDLTELTTNFFLHNDPDFSYNKGERHFGSFRFDLACESGVFTETTEQIEIIPIYSTFFGFPLPFPIPFTLGNSNQTMVKPYNKGNEQAETIIQFTKKVTNPNVKNKKTGQSFTITETIEDGDEMLVDSLNNTVLLKRVGEITYSNITTKFLGTWIKLAPGENEIIFTGQNTNSQTTLNIKWFNSYIGI